MLAQLVCVDRRYQRMNSFNARELQALLKQRFFTDIAAPFAMHTSWADLKHQAAYTLGTESGIAAPLHTHYLYMRPVAQRAHSADLLITKYDYKAGNYAPAALVKVWPTFVETSAAVTTSAVAAN